jgi:ParB/RepB/Spo0J family partition protein
MTTTGPAVSDSAGITGTALAAIELPAAALAPHPANPREELGDLDELAASISEIGVLEPLVVATVAAHLAGGWPAAADGATHVILAGHRRYAAALRAGRAVLPCVIRDDLAGDDALIVMLAENDPAKRHQLPVLGEARAFAELAARGWSQRQIAARMGCGQPHVSKRIALLRLPEEATAAIAAGKLTAADGAELVKLADHPDLTLKALEDISSSPWAAVAGVVSRYQHQMARQAAAEAARAQFEAEGIPVVDPGTLGPYGYAMRLRGGADLEPHRQAGCLVGAAASHSGEPELYCRKPGSHEGTPAAVPGWSTCPGAGPSEHDQARAEEGAQRKAAARGRRAVAAQLAARSLPGPAAADVIARALIARHADAQCLKTAMGWLRAAGVGPAEGDYDDFARHITSTGNDAEVRRLAVAMALAAEERAADGSQFGVTQWGRRQVLYLDRLISEAGYEPGEWEQAQLAEARARVQARDELSCPACGCRDAQSCAGVWPRCDVEPDGVGAWSYRCACTRKARQEPAAGDGADADDVYDALEDLVAVAGPAGSIAARLPAAAQDAIEIPLEAFSELWADQTGDGSTDKLLAAAGAVVDAAEPWRKDWPPQLAEVADRLDAATRSQQ